jgi:hypothetical protein
MKKKEDNFGKKNKRNFKKWKKNMRGKIKPNSQLAQYKKKFDKDNLKKNKWGNTVAKQKLYRETL